MRKNMQGFGAILAAAKENDVEALSLALEAGMSVNATNQIGQSALHVAAIWGNAEVTLQNGFQKLHLCSLPLLHLPA